METSKLIINSIIYIIVTSFFVWLLIKEKEIGAKIKIYRDKFSDTIIKKYKMILPKTLGDVLKFIQEIIGLIFLTLMIFNGSMNIIVLVGIIIMIGSYAFTQIQTEKEKANEGFLLTLGLFVAVGVLILANMFSVVGLFWGLKLLLIINILIGMILVFRTEDSIRKTVDWGETAVTAIILVLAIQYFYIGNFLVPTGSMIPTILPGDRLFGNMVVYKFFKPERGDILVFKEPTEDKFLYTKRLIGLPGEKIKIGEDNRVYINGTKLEGARYKTEVVENEKIILKDRDYFRGGELLDNEITIPKKGDTYEWIVSEKKFLLNGTDETTIIYDVVNNQYLAEKLDRGEKIILDENYYFTLGDNSGNSKDSRYWGFVAEHRIKGKPMVRFWPLNRIGWVK